MMPQMKGDTSLLCAKPHLKCDLTSAITRALRSALLSEGRCSKICALPRLLVMIITQFLKLTV
jgi:hypothetical protein